ncbi:MAG: MFS transporter [Candidatus Heimdallarchaeaceae archaeon]|jgi:MFS family permease
MRKETQTLFGLMLSSFIINLGFGAILPFLALYAESFFQVWDWGFVQVNIVTQIGLLTSAMMISRAFLAPFYGKMSDKAGRKPIMVVGMAMYVVLTFGFGLASAFWSLFLVRFFQGVASALVWPIAESAVVDISAEDKRGRNLGWFILSMSLGWSVGPFLGGGLFAFSEVLIGQSFTTILGTNIVSLTNIFGLAEVTAFKITFFFMGGISAISFVVFNLMVIDPKTGKAKMSLKEIGIAIKEVIVATYPIIVKAILMTVGLPVLLILKFIAKKEVTFEVPGFLTPKFWRERTRSLKALFFMGFSNGFGFSMVFPILSLFLEERYLLTPEYIGIVFGIAGIAGVTFNPIGGYLADKTSKKTLVIVTAILSGSFLFFLGFEMTGMLLIGLFIVRQMIQQINMPAFRALQADLVEPEKRGLEFGNVQMFFNLGSVIGPVIGGILYDQFREVTWALPNINIFGIEVIMIITTILAYISATIIGIFVKKEDMVVDIKKIEEIEKAPIVIEGE